MKGLESLQSVQNTTKSDRAALGGDGPCGPINGARGGRCEGKHRDYAQAHAIIHAPADPPARPHTPPLPAGCVHTPCHTGLATFEQARHISVPPPGGGDARGGLHGGLEGGVAVVGEVGSELLDEGLEGAAVAEDPLELDGQPAVGLAQHEHVLRQRLRGKGAWGGA